jgi:hypothetical protein
VSEFWGRGLDENAWKGIAGAPEMVKSSLGYLASYARIAIQIRDFSPWQLKWRSARVIKLRKAARLR